MNPPPNAPRARHRYWPWILGFLLTPPVVLGLMLWSAVHLNRDAAALRQQLMVATGSDWHTQVQLSASPLLLSVLRAGVGCLHDLPPEARAALGAVRSASVGVYERGRSRAPASRDRLLAAADEVMSGRGWTRIVGVADGGDTVMIYLPTGVENSTPSSICLAVCNNRELVVVAAQVEPDALAALASGELNKRRLAGL